MQALLPIEQYDSLLAEKQKKLTALLAPFHAPALAVF
ncbi:tRNA (uracil-5-)-methyltransferase, partial [Pasteurella multocida 2000]